MRAAEAFGLLLLCICLAASASAQGSGGAWKTLSGDPPLVVARGGVSGIFPDSSDYAYGFVPLTSSPDTVLYCDVQLTKDSMGICYPTLKLENSSNIDFVYSSKRQSTYLVNGVPTTAYFPNDFTLDELSNVTLIRGILSRPPQFDAYGFQILTVQDVATNYKPPGLWLNIEHDAFYTQHNLSMRSFLLAASRNVVVNYISSPECNFLKGIASRFNPNITKLVFRFLGQDDIEPTTNQTYGSLLKNLTTIKTFASGILVPKEYIWPVDGSNYLLAQHTSVVSDAHTAGLEVYASGFANDNVFSYNYSYDPVAEYLSFVDNGDFSVDGVLSDYPMTPSAVIGCYSQIDKNASVTVNPLVISYNGASGDYPGCTDLAYQKAISDGADILDCSVQMTKDGVPICLGSINLIDSTTVSQTEFSTLLKSVPELGGEGIYTFDLDWADIQSLTPQIENPYANAALFRNPRAKNDGKLVSLADFLALANMSTVSGVLLSIENAAYLARKGLGVTDAVLDSLTKAGFDAPTSKKVMIQSTNSSVLEEFKGKNKYELVYFIDELVRDVLNSTIQDIKSFADSVVLTKGSVFIDHSAFLTEATDTIEKFHASNVHVYTRLFVNEFISQAWDFFSDAHVELNSFVQGAGVDGIITAFPKTAISFRRNKCLSMKTPPGYSQPIQPGALLGLIPKIALPPAEAPYPVLEDSDVNEPPLPSVEIAPAPSNTTHDSPSPTSPNGQTKLQSLSILSTLLLLLALALLI
uniref:glycerophosphodiester phosphodiesterase n=1 Tax=Kalanchoe fedtschenkoi TaxID=63787 RepID=A0A7N0U282_KALFE